MLGFVPIGMPLAQPTTVTMTPNNKAVKGCGGLPFLFTELPRRFFPETRLPLNSILGNSGARRAKEGGRGFSVGASVFLLYDSPLREELHEGGESAGDIRSYDCNHPHRHLA